MASPMIILGRGLRIYPQWWILLDLDPPQIFTVTLQDLPRGLSNGRRCTPTPEPTEDDRDKRTIFA